MKKQRIYTLLLILGSSFLLYRTIALLATLFHAFLILVFEHGRTGPWINFDVKPEYYEFYSERWS